MLDIALRWIPAATADHHPGRRHRRPGLRARRDSTAILLRWLLDLTPAPSAWTSSSSPRRQTGNEFADSGRLVEQFIYPLLALHQVRTVQVAGASGSQSDGITVLDDTTSPSRCYIAGDYTLGDEMLAAGLVPQSGGARLCSAKSKGWPLDLYIANLTHGRPFWHAMGFETGEMSRVRKDSPWRANRRPWYPLVEWGWDREACERYIYDKLGVWWPKSCCSFCPFALASREGRARTIARYLANPDEAMLGLLMEFVAVALNPRQGLIGGKQLLHLLQATPGCEDLVELLDAHLDAQQWALYEVRRAFRAKAGDDTKPANAVRSLTKIAVGSRTGMLAALDQVAAEVGGSIDEFGKKAAPTGRPPIEADGWHHRVWLRRRQGRYPCAEHAYVIAPATADDKTGPGFAKAWHAGLAGPADPAGRSMFEPRPVAIRP